MAVVCRPAPVKQKCVKEKSRMKDKVGGSKSGSGGWSCLQDYSVLHIALHQIILNIWSETSKLTMVPVSPYMDPLSCFELTV